MANYKTFAYEFHEESQAWHRNYGESIENTNGGLTIISNWTKQKTDLFRMIVDLQKGNKQKLTIDFLLKCKDVLEQVTETVNTHLEKSGIYKNI